ncbi:helix-turn-helix transcriptional regulator [Pseudoxanthomonas spadix]|nr:sigma-70 family RNA polymerase sigma factor [Pseudoxanthomonas spadix]
MDTSETECLDNLADRELVERLGCADWDDPLFISEERLVQLFQVARAAGNTTRVGLFTSELSRRISRRSLSFALKNSLVPQHFSDIKEAAYELSAYVWERLLKDKNAQFAARRFGVFFKNQSISFLRSILAQCRARMDSLEEWHHVEREEDDGDGDDEDGGGDDADTPLQDEWTPDLVLGRARGFEQLHARLQSLLTRNEYSVFVMLWRQQMKIKDIAAALGVTPRTINNYERSIKDKINKEFNV